MLTLILGGARSGKSTYALALAREAVAGKVLFVATAEAHDDEMTARITAHRGERPGTWDTLEEPRALTTALASAANDYDLVIIDCLTLWVSNLLLATPSPIDPVEATAPLLDVYERHDPDWIVVSNEVGLGLVPDTPLGRTYRDILGAVNRRVATAADTVLFMVAGQPLKIKPPPLPG
jgi:adenosylcobinamide kinase / adenosylcobinamide-phosphate guanylyltransferase